MSYGNIQLADSEYPTVTGLSAIPNPIDIYNFINISATVTDNTGVKYAIIEVERPDTTRANYTTTHDGYVYYNDNIFTEESGTYTYRLYASDDVGNINNTEAGTFIVQGVENSLITNLSERIEQLEQNRQITDEKILNLTNEIESLKLQNYDNNITELQNQIQNLQFQDEDLRNQLNDIDARYQTNITEVSSRIDELTNWFGGLANRVGILELNISRFAVSIANLTGRVNTLGITLGGLQTNVTNLTGRVGVLEVTMSGLSSTVNSLTSTVNRVLAYLTGLPVATKQQMICYYMQKNNLTSYSDLGMTCKITKGKCNCA
jgi:conjugal transfer/entry exclusion protein